MVCAGFLHTHGNILVIILIILFLFTEKLFVLHLNKIRYFIALWLLILRETIVGKNELVFKLEITFRDT